MQPHLRSAPDLQEEAALLRAAHQLDKGALEQIHQRYYRPLYRYISMRVSDPLEVEDLTSEVFTRLLYALKEGKAPRKTLRGWLYSVASNIVNDYYRRQYRADIVEAGEDLASIDTGPLELLERKFTKRQLINAVMQLTEDQQSVIALRFGSGMAIRDVAKTMGKTEGAIKQLQARAIASLGRLLSERDVQ